MEFKKGDRVFHPYYDWGTVWKVYKNRTTEGEDKDGNVITHTGLIAVTFDSEAGEDDGYGNPKVLIMLDNGYEDIPGTGYWFNGVLYPHEEIKLMTKAEGLICNFVANWLDDNFDKITYDLTKSNLPNNKIDLTRKVGKDPQLAMWVITELAYWDKGVEEPDITVFVEDGYKVLKIHSEYIRVDSVNYTWNFKIVKPKKKTVIIYE